MDTTGNAQTHRTPDPWPHATAFSAACSGGAVGDALGAPVEFMSRAAILRQFGPDGIGDYAPAYGGLGKITDDTQMTLFTAEGLLRGWVREATRGIPTTYSGVTRQAYQRWLATQGARSLEDLHLGPEPGWLVQQPELHHRRAPGNTCLSALRATPSDEGFAINDSKGCGGVMRVAPAGLFTWRNRDRHQAEEAFRLGTELAALTHGHPTGSLTGGVLAVLVSALADGGTLVDGLADAKACLVQEADHEETLGALEQAERLAASSIAPADAIAELGEGWVSEEALAISVYCALVARDFRHGVILAVNHDGDSDSTGAVTGNLLGALYGVSAIPAEWLEPLELRDVITEIAEDLFAFRDWEVGEFSANKDLSRQIWDKYPGY
jgi:ADP-ribosylglycohydrolase